MVADTDTLERWCAAKCENGSGGTGKVEIRPTLHFSLGKSEMAHFFLRLTPRESTQRRKLPSGSYLSQKEFLVVVVAVFLTFVHCRPNICMEYVVRCLR